MREIQSLIEALVSGDEPRAEAAANEIPKLGEAALGELLELRRSDVPDERWWATRALANFQCQAAAEALRESLSDRDLGVRQCATLALRHVPSPAAIPALLQAMASDDALLSRLASDALTAVGPPALQPLKRAARSQHAGTRLGAIRALGHMAIPDAVPILFAALDDPSPLVQFWAEDGLQRIGVGMVFFQK
jgi:bilin biosynthesis protein